MKIIVLILLIICSASAAHASVKDYIESYSLYFEKDSYRYYSDFIKNQKQITAEEKSRIIDKELESELGTTFIYVDLAECIRIAFSDNYDIHISDAEVLSLYWKHKNSVVGILPDFFYDYNISNLSGKYLIGGILASYAHEVPIQSFFNLNWSTINQGKYFFQMAIARHCLEAGRHNLEFTKDETILKTVIAYYDLLSDKLQIEVQKLNLYQRVEQLKYTQGRYEAGIGTLYDVKRAQAEVAGAQQEYTTVLNNFRLTQAKLANVIGVDIFTPLYPYEIKIDTRELVHSSFGLDKLYSQALNSREDIKSKISEINMYRAKRSLNYADVIPSVNISYKNGHVGTKRSGLGPSNTITIDITANLGKNMLAGTITQIKAESAEVKQKKLELENLKRQIKEDILNSYYDSLNAVTKIEAAKVEVEAADMSLDLSVENMKAGQATFIDVISSQNLKVKSNLNLIKNMIEYNKAQTKLLFDTGIISPKNVLKDYKTRY